MARREMTIKFRLSSAEYAALKRNAAKMKMTVSEYIRFTAVHSDNLEIVTINTAPLEKLSLELTRQGTNLNQFIKFLNTYGADAYSEQRASQILTQEGEAFLRVVCALADLRHEAAKRRVYILNDSSDESVDNDSHTSAQ